MRPEFLSSDRRRRAGWALIMVALFLIAERLLNDAGRKWVLAPLAHRGVKQMIELGGGPAGLSPYYILALEVMTALTATLVTVGLAAVERRPWTSFGIAGDRKLAWFGNGFIAGLLGFSLLVGLLAATGTIQLSTTALTGWTAVHFGLIWLIAMIVLGVHEEMSGRGYPFLRLSEGTGPVIAALVTTAIFVNGHRANAGENLIGLLQVGAFGLLACFSVWRTGSLWWAIGFHCTWDWAQVFVFGTIGSGVRFAGSVLTATPAGPAWLSGGSDGPEGSVLALVGLGVGAVALFAMPRRKEA